ncbi:MAG: hypothetical protein UU14_C0037G0009 [Candidatus Roizmanbacteria bacterium GW2011_GWB1_40_7]|uniref:Uncharacterized protein n=1 Tax=Candidatus Roizmanbacteria bacterium GW2011_GWB1_40_7 TaxID=1618482 RepID=A0A0G0VG46_9BACT|nr:MAG: hypothetical protein UU14_C0037G0009 [Candidatus Roizmanbacteria bacterium GW2011_GWB1_40_7]
MRIDFDQSRRNFLLSTGGLALAAVLGKSAVHAQAATEVAPPLGEQLINPAGLFSLAELHEFHEIAQAAHLSFDRDNPEVIQYIQSMVFHSLKALGADEAIAAERIQRILFDFDETSPNTCKSSTCEIRPGWLVITGQYMNEGDDWNRFRYLLNHESGHHITKPVDSSGLIPVTEDYGYTRYEVYADDGFAPKILSTSGNAPNLHTKGVKFLHGETTNIVEVVILEELNAELSGAMASTRTGFIENPSNESYFYGFAGNGIRFLDYNITNGNRYLEPWQQVMNFPSMNGYYLRNDRYGLTIALGDQVIRANPNICRLPENWRAGLGNLYAAAVMFGYRDNYEVAHRLDSDYITETDIADLACHMDNLIHEN